MVDGAKPQNSYERKLKLMLDIALKRFDGNYTPEEYAMELTVAKNILNFLGVKP